MEIGFEIRESTPVFYSPVVALQPRPEIGRETESMAAGIKERDVSRFPSSRATERDGAEAGLGWLGRLIARLIDFVSFDFSLPREEGDTSWTKKRNACTRFDVGHWVVPIKFRLNGSRPRVSGYFYSGRSPGSLFQILARIQPVQYKILVG